MKHFGVKRSMYIDFNKENNKEGCKFKVGDNVRKSKYKNIFGKSYILNWSEKVFVNNIVKHNLPWTQVISDLKGEEIFGTFYERELQKINQTKYRIKKVRKTKGNKLYVQCKDYDNSVELIKDII